VSLSRFHDGRSGATHFVRVFSFGRELRIAGDDGATIAVWKLERLEAAPELDPDGVLTLTARGEPGVLLIDDGAELELLRRAGVKMPGHKAWRQRHWISVCAGLAATIIAGVLLVNALPRWLTPLIPLSWEQRLGAPTEALITGSKKRCVNAAGQAALDRLVARLRAAGHIEMPVTISVLDDRLINAFTLPGGHVLLMHGLIDNATDGAMLAGVIAHELGHVMHRDSTTLLLRGMGFSILMYMIGIGEFGGSAASAAANLMSLAYSRAAEVAADDAAIELLTKAGLRADGLSRFFARMEQREAAADKEDGGPSGARSGSSLDWLSNHPPSEARRERTVRPETGETPFTDAEWQAIRAMCAR